MAVRRQMHRLPAFFHLPTRVLAALLRHVGRPAAPQGLRPLAAVAATGAHAQHGGVARGLRNWLEDARTLRPARVPRPAPQAAVEQPTERPSAPPTSGFARRAAVSRPRPAAAAGEFAEFVLPPLTSVPLDAWPDVLPGVSAAQMRRLVLLRYLVRQRVYNEGFPVDAQPAQYRFDENG